MNYSTVRQILHNRAYVGEMRHKDEWLPGSHEPLVSEEEFDAAHRGRIPGRKRGRDLMSGRIACGLCGRRMSIDGNGQGQKHYRCKHRGEGCSMPSRSNRGPAKAAGLGLALLCDGQIREAIRTHLLGCRSCTTSGPSSWRCTTATRSAPISSARNRPASPSRSRTSKRRPPPRSSRRCRATISR